MKMPVVHATADASRPGVFEIHEERGGRKLHYATRELPPGAIVDESEPAAVAEESFAGLDREASAPASTRKTRFVAPPTEQAPPADAEIVIEAPAGE